MERIPGKPERNQAGQLIAMGVKNPGRLIPIIVVNFDLLSLKPIRELAGTLLQLFEWRGISASLRRI